MTAPSITAGCTTRLACPVVGRSASRAPVSGATSSAKNLRRLPLPICRPSSSTAVRATKTIASKPSSSSQAALEKIGTQLLSFAGKDRKNRSGSGADTIIVPAGVESLITRRIIFSLLRAGKRVVAGALCVVWKVGTGMHVHNRKDGVAEDRKERRARGRERAKDKRKKQEGKKTSHKRAPQNSLIENAILTLTLFSSSFKNGKKREKTAVDDVETATLDLVLLTKLELLKKSEAARLALVDASEGFEEDDLPPGSTMLLVGGGRALGGAAARELAAAAEDAAEARAGRVVLVTEANPSTDAAAASAVRACGVPFAVVTLPPLDDAAGTDGEWADLPAQAAPPSALPRGPGAAAISTRQTGAALVALLDAVASPRSRSESVEIAFWARREVPLVPTAAAVAAAVPASTVGSAEDEEPLFSSPRVKGVASDASASASSSTSPPPPSLALPKISIPNFGDALKNRAEEEQARASKSASPKGSAPPPSSPSSSFPPPFVAAFSGLFGGSVELDEDDSSSSDEELEEELLANPLATFFAGIKEKRDEAAAAARAKKAAAAARPPPPPTPRAKRPAPPQKPAAKVSPAPGLFDGLFGGGAGSSKPAAAVVAEPVTRRKRAVAPRPPPPARVKARAAPPPPPPKRAAAPAAKRGGGGSRSASPSSEPAKKSGGFFGGLFSQDTAFIDEL